MADPIKPTAADREAAANLTANGDPNCPVANLIRAGFYDEERDVQAFALHAQQAREQALEEAAKVAALDSSAAKHACATLKGQSNAG